MNQRRGVSPFLLSQLIGQTWQNCTPCSLSYALPKTVKKKECLAVERTELEREYNWDSVNERRMKRALCSPLQPAMVNLCASSESRLEATRLDSSSHDLNPPPHERFIFYLHLSFDRGLFTHLLLFTWNRPTFNDCQCHIYFRLQATNSKWDENNRFFIFLVWSHNNVQSKAWQVAFTVIPGLVAHVTFEASISWQQSERGRCARLILLSPRAAGFRWAYHCASAPAFCLF